MSHRDADTASAPALVPVERLAINFRWFCKLRWAAIGGQIAALAYCRIALGIDWPWDGILAMLGILTASNLALDRWLARRNRLGWDGWQQKGTALLGSIMALDTLLLTGLVYASGGSENPFTICYLINVSLAAVMLHPRWAWSLCGLAIACFAFLFLEGDPLIAQVGMGHGHAAANPVPQFDGMRRHLQGMLVAFATAAALIVLFITRVTNALARRDAELAVAQQRKADHERLESLATLAAGAAHELSTPLSTIAIVAHELRIASDAIEDDAVRSEVEVICSQVDRCRRILDDLASSSGQNAGERSTWISPGQLAERSLAEIADLRLRICVEAPPGETHRLPARTLGQAIRALAKNALEASPDNEPVDVAIRSNGTELSVVVTDRGPGMNEATLRRAGDPFFTTKEPGKGMGLGLFLARQVAEQLDGRLTLTSQPGQGTAATLAIPVAVRAEFDDRGTAESIAGNARVGSVST